MPSWPLKGNQIDGQVFLFIRQVIVHVLLLLLLTGKLQFGVSQIDKTYSEYKGYVDEFVAFNEELQEDDMKRIAVN